MHNFLLQSGNLVKEVNSPCQTKMMPKFEEPIKNKFSLIEISDLPEVSVVIHNKKHEIIHESAELTNKLKKRVGTAGVRYR
jgi:hypothetical protein